MSCRQAVCQECATTWDGINYCRPCLAKRRVATASSARGLAILSGIGMGLAMIALAVAVVRLMAWSMAQVGTWQS